MSEGRGGREAAGVTPGCPPPPSRVAAAPVAIQLGSHAAQRSTARTREGAANDGDVAESHGSDGAEACNQVAAGARGEHRRRSGGSMRQCLRWQGWALVTGRRQQQAACCKQRIPPLPHRTPTCRWG